MLRTGVTLETESRLNVLWDEEKVKRCCVSKRKLRTEKRSPEFWEICEIGNYALNYPTHCKTENRFDYGSELNDEVLDSEWEHVQQNHCIKQITPRVLSWLTDKLCLAVSTYLQSLLRSVKNKLIGLDFVQEHLINICPNYSMVGKSVLTTKTHRICSSPVKSRHCLTKSGGRWSFNVLFDFLKHLMKSNPTDTVREWTWWRRCGYRITMNCSLREAQVSTDPGGM